MNSIAIAFVMLFGINALVTLTVLVFEVMGHTEIIKVKDQDDYDDEKEHLQEQGQKLFE